MAIGGSGDPPAMELDYIEKLLKSIGSIIEALEQEQSAKLFVSIAFSTSDPSFVNSDTVQTILDSSPVSPCSIEISLSYKTLSSIK